VLVLLRLTARLDVVWALLSVVPISLLLSVVIALIDYGGGTHGNAGAGS
jgi:hypothetical protein